MQVRHSPLKKSAHDVAARGMNEQGRMGLAHLVRPLVAGLLHAVASTAPTKN